MSQRGAGLSSRILKLAETAILHHPHRVLPGTRKPSGHLVLELTTAPLYLTVALKLNLQRHPAASRARGAGEVASFGVYVSGISW